MYSLSFGALKLQIPLNFWVPLNLWVPLNFWVPLNLWVPLNVWVPFHTEYFDIEDFEIGSPIQQFELFGQPLCLTYTQLFVFILFSHLLPG